MAWKDLINSAIDAYFDDPFSKTMAKAVVNGIVVVIIGIITKEAIRTNLDEEERKRKEIKVYTDTFKMYNQILFLFLCLIDGEIRRLMYNTNPQMVCLL